MLGGSNFRRFWPKLWRFLKKFVGAFFRRFLWLFGKNKALPESNLLDTLLIFMKIGCLMSLIKRIVTRKVSFWFGIFFYIFFCTCHCFWMQKLSFVPKNEFIPDVQFRVIANLLFLAFFDNFCSNCPRMICIDARTMTSISSSSV